MARTATHFASSVMQFVIITILLLLLHQTASQETVATFNSSNIRSPIGLYTFPTSQQIDNTPLPFEDGSPIDKVKAIIRSQNFGESQHQVFQASSFSSAPSLQSVTGLHDEVWYDGLDRPDQLSQPKQDATIGSNETGLDKLTLHHQHLAVLVARFEDLDRSETPADNALETQAFYNAQEMITNDIFTLQQQSAILGFDDQLPVDPKTAPMPWGNVKIQHSIQNQPDEIQTEVKHQFLTQAYFESNWVLPNGGNPILDSQPIAVMAISVDQHFVADIIKCSIRSFSNRSLYYWSEDTRNLTSSTLTTNFDLLRLMETIQPTRTYKWLKDRNLLQTDVFVQCQGQFSVDFPLYTNRTIGKPLPIFTGISVGPDFTPSYPDLDPVLHPLPVPTSFMGIFLIPVQPFVMFVNSNSPYQPTTIPNAVQEFSLSVADLAGPIGSKFWFNIDSTIIDNPLPYSATLVDSFCRQTQSPPSAFQTQQQEPITLRNADSKIKTRQDLLDTVDKLQREINSGKNILDPNETGTSPGMTQFDFDELKKVEAGLNTISTSRIPTPQDTSAMATLASGIVKPTEQCTFPIAQNPGDQSFFRPIDEVVCYNFNTFADSLGVPRIPLMKIRILPYSCFDLGCGTSNRGKGTSVQVEFLQDFPETGPMPWSTTAENYGRCSFLVGFRQQIKSSPARSGILTEPIPTNGSIKDVVHARGASQDIILVSFGFYKSWFDEKSNPSNLSLAMFAAFEDESTKSLTVGFLLEATQAPIHAYLFPLYDELGGVVKGITFDGKENGETHLLPYFKSPLFTMDNLPYRTFPLQFNGFCDRDLGLLPVQWAGQTRWKLTLDAANYYIDNNNKLNNRFSPGFYTAKLWAFSCEFPLHSLPHPADIPRTIPMTFMYNTAVRSLVQYRSISDDGVVSPPLGPLAPPLHSGGSRFWIGLGDRQIEASDVATRRNGSWTVTAGVEAYLTMVIENLWFTPDGGVAGPSSTAGSPDLLLQDLGVFFRFGAGGVLTENALEFFHICELVNPATQEQSLVTVHFSLFGTTLYLTYIRERLTLTDWAGFTFQCVGIPIIPLGPVSDIKISPPSPIKILAYDQEVYKTLVTFIPYPAQTVNVVSNWAPDFNDCSAAVDRPVLKGTKSSLHILLPRTSFAFLPRLDEVKIEFPGIVFQPADDLGGECQVVFRRNTPTKDFDPIQNLLGLPVQVMFKPNQPSAFFINQVRGFSRGWIELDLRNSVDYLSCTVDLIVDDYQPGNRPNGVLQAVSIPNLFVPSIALFPQTVLKSLGQFPGIFELNGAASLDFKTLSSAQAASHGLSLAQVPTISFSLESTTTGLHYLYSPFTYQINDNRCLNPKGLVVATVRKIDILDQQFPNGLTVSSPDQALTVTIQPKTLFEVTFNSAVALQRCVFTAVSLFNSPLVDPHSVFFAAGREAVASIFPHPLLQFLSSGVLFKSSREDVEITIFNTAIRPDLDNITLDFYLPPRQAEFPVIDNQDYRVKFTQYAHDPGTVLSKSRVADAKGVASVFTANVPMTRVEIQFHRTISSADKQFSFVVPSTLPSTAHPQILSTIRSSLNGVKTSFNTLFPPRVASAQFLFTIRPPTLRGTRQVIGLSFQVTPDADLIFPSLTVDLFSAGFPEDPANECFYQLRDSSVATQPQVVSLPFYYSARSRFVLSMRLPKLSSTNVISIECYMSPSSVYDPGTKLTASLSDSGQAQYQIAKASSTTTPSPPIKPLQFTTFTLFIEGFYRDDVGAVPSDDALRIFSDYVIDQFPGMNLSTNAFSWFRYSPISSFSGNAAFYDPILYRQHQRQQQQPSDGSTLSAFEFQNFESVQSSPFLHTSLNGNLYTIRAPQDMTSSPFSTQNSISDLEVLEGGKLHDSSFLPPSVLSALHQDRVNQRHDQSRAKFSGLELESRLSQEQEQKPPSLAQTLALLADPFGYGYVAPTSLRDVAAATYFNATLSVRVPSFLSPDHINDIFLAATDSKITFHSPTYTLSMNLHTTSASKPTIVPSEEQCFVGNFCGAGCSHLCPINAGCTSNFDCESRFCRLFSLSKKATAQNLITIPNLVVGPDGRGSYRQCDQTSHRSDFGDYFNVKDTKN